MGKHGLRGGSRPIAVRHRGKHNKPIKNGDIERLTAEIRKSWTDEERVRRRGTTPLEAVLINLVATNQVAIMRAAQEINHMAEIIGDGRRALAWLFGPSKEGFIQWVDVAACLGEDPEDGRDKILRHVDERALNALLRKPPLYHCPICGPMKVNPPPDGKRCFGD